MNPILTIGSAHIRRIDRASPRRIRKMVQDALSLACDRARSQGARPIAAVDDLTMHAVGPWMNIFGRCLARAAKREGISIVGGEMAQMEGSYKVGRVGVVVTVVSIRP